MVGKKRNRGSRDTDFKYVDLKGVPIYKLLGVKQKTVRTWNADGKLGDRLKAAGVTVRSGLVNEAVKLQRRGRAGATLAGKAVDATVQPIGMPTPTVTVVTRMPVELRARLQTLVNATGFTIQSVVVAAVDKYLEEQK